MTDTRTRDERRADVARVLTERLRARRWTGRALAKYAGVNVNTVARALRGQQVPDAENMRRIARALEMDEADALRLAGHRLPPPELPYDTQALHVARELSDLPAGARERAIDGVLFLLRQYREMVEDGVVNDAAVEQLVQRLSAMPEWLRRLVVADLDAHAERIARIAALAGAHDSGGIDVAHYSIDELAALLQQIKRRNPDLWRQMGGESGESPGRRRAAGT